MAASDVVVEEFDDLGFTLSEPQIIDRLVALCDIYKTPEEKVACEYLAYLNQKKYPINQSPTIEILEGFENEALKHLVAKKNEKSTGPIVYNSSTISQYISRTEENNLDDEDEDGDISSFYGANDKKTDKLKSVKREFSPDGKAYSAKKRIGEINKENLSSNSPNISIIKDVENFSTPNSQNQKYSSRTNAGQVLIRFGNGGHSLPADTWNTKDTTLSPEIVVKSETIDKKEYRYMFERLREKAGYLDETICRIGDILLNKNSLADPQPVFQISPEPFQAVGRICCDSDGKLNSKSIVLQGSQDICLGRSIPLEAVNVSENPLFPGQIVAAEVANPTGKRLIASKIYSDCSGSKAPNKFRISDKEELQVVIASGPYTTSDNLSYDPLDDLCVYVEKHKPHLVILCGPFVDVKHNMIDSCSCEEPFEIIFARVMKKIVNMVESLPNTEVFMVPSGSRDVHHTFIYPTPPFEQPQQCNKIHMMTDPCIVNVDGITFGITSTDILFHMGKEEMAQPRAGDRFRRLASHLIQQQSFYPLYPPSEEMNIDYELLEKVACLDVQPHVLILPSDFQHFFKEVNGSLVMNPQRLVRGDGGNVFTRMVIKGASTPAEDFTKQVCAEVVRI